MIFLNVFLTNNLGVMKIYCEFYNFLIFNSDKIIFIFVIFCCDSFFFSSYLHIVYLFLYSIYSNLFFLHSYNVCSKNLHLLIILMKISYESVGFFFFILQPFYVFKEIHLEVFLLSNVSLKVSWKLLIYRFSRQLFFLEAYNCYKRSFTMQDESISID